MADYSVKSSKKWGKSWTAKPAKIVDQARSSSAPLSNPAHADEQGSPQDVLDVPYRSARRKLKIALLEYYRGLELLKSYAYLNRKAFRKMNKKYDKVTSAKPTGRYMSEKVNKAWFVQSEVVENHMAATEELYARYFERGNRKAAVAKLRGKTKRFKDRSANSFRIGLMFAAGVMLMIFGFIRALVRLQDKQVGGQTGYLLQVRPRPPLRGSCMLTLLIDIRWLLPCGLSFSPLLPQLQDMGLIEDQLCLCFRI
jgi:hypothetical protein